MNSPPPSSLRPRGSHRVLRRLRNTALAWTGLWLFIGGTLVLPAIHNFNHHDDHQHGDEIHEHRHETASPLSIDFLNGGRSRATDHLGRTPAPSHGHGAAAHFGLSLTPTPIFLIPPPSTRAQELALPSFSEVLVSIDLRPVKAARGPPPRRSLDTLIERG